MEWNLAEAKNKFSEVVNRAVSEGPQTIRRRKDTVILISEYDYNELKNKQQSFKEFLINVSPSLEDADISRDRSEMRNIKL